MKGTVLNNVSYNKCGFAPPILYFIHTIFQCVTLSFKDIHCYNSCVTAAVDQTTE